VRKRERSSRPPEGVRSVVDTEGRQYVLVPSDEYERLVIAGAAIEGVRRLEDVDDASKWADADDLALQIAGDRIARARKKAGLTQTELGRKLNLPQSQISRIERNPDRTTVRTLKRIAKALGVDVRAIVG
jgi:DNA-binding XRE family transcriptional regulator